MSFSQPNGPIVSQHSFAMVPRSDIPRSVFNRDHTVKTTFNSGLVIPHYVDEILPGDSVRIGQTSFCRVSPNAFVAPIMDNIFLDVMYFFCPDRLLWDNFERFMGDRTPNTDSSTDFLVPITAAISNVPVGSRGDYMGLPTQTLPGSITPVSLPGRAYILIWNEWFRDENMQNKAAFLRTDGPDSVGVYTLAPLPRGKRADYFTSSLPFAQKGPAVSLPLGVSAPVRTSAANVVTGVQPVLKVLGAGGAAAPSPTVFGALNAAGDVTTGQTLTIGANTGIYPSNLYADLSQATAAQINTIRQAVTIQQYLEKDARGGTRYTEKVVSHFGVHPQDFRLQRPEYIGGGSYRLNVNAVAQTSETSTTPLGQLAGVGTGGFHTPVQYSALEHGYIMGFVSVRSDNTYQQGMHRMWSRRTLYDYYWPTFAHLGEQAVLRKEIYAQGTADDDLVFGYQERYAEYRYKPSMITGRFRSGITNSLDRWHLAQYFTSAPTLSPTFIQEDVPLPRVLAGGQLSRDNHQEFLCDTTFHVRHVRAMPMFSVPGLTRF